MIQLRRLTLALVIATCAFPASPVQAVDVSVPSSPPNTITAVKGNFLGVSFELSAFDKYFGSNATTVKSQTVNHLNSYSRLLSGIPLRVRIGGRSSENYTYAEVFASGPGGEPKPSDGTGVFGPTVVGVLQTLSKRLGVTYLLNLSLKEPSGQGLMAFATTTKLELQNIDAYTLGSGPDLYLTEGIRPESSNYTINDYVKDYNTSFTGFQHLAFGDLNGGGEPLMAGPTVSGGSVPEWDLATVLQGDWFSSYKSELKYITLQRITPEVCAAVIDPTFNASHPNVVREGQWQQQGLIVAKSTGKPIVLSQYSITATDCKGNIPNTFTGTLWTIDYALQLASVGYSALYMHTKERGNDSNLFDYPNEGTNFETKPVHYAYPPVMLALQSFNGSKVVDLNVNGLTNAGYAVYDSATSNLYRVVLINYAGNGTTFTLPKTVGGNNVTAAYLTAPKPEEALDITWAGLTWAKSGDGQPAGKQEYKTLSCASGCDVQVPGPGAVVVMFNKQLPPGEPSGGGPSGNFSANNTSGGNNGGSTNGSSKPASVIFGGIYSLVFFALISLAML